jgi:hypothetical protein
LLYRSYGLLLVVVALLVVAQGFRDRLPLGLTIAGLVLCVDLPLRFLGQIVPWRRDDVEHWYVSIYRGSHVFFIPTWLVGVASLIMGGACFVSPDFQRALERTGNEPQAKKEIKPVEPPPVLPKESLALTIEEMPPFSGTKFRYTVTNRTGAPLKGVTEFVRYKAPNAAESKSAVPRGDLLPSETRSEEIRVFGPSAEWVHVEITGMGANQKPRSVESEWRRKK